MEELTQRLWDLNRNIGQPHQITTIFGRRVTKLYQGQLQTVIEDLDLPHPVIHSRYGHGFAKPYVRDDRLLRTEPATNRVYDYGVNQDVENLPRLGERMSEIIDQYHNVQPDVLETFIDRGPLRKFGRTDDPAQRQTDSRPAARSPASTGRDACAGALLPYLWLPAGGLLRRISMLRL